MLTRRVPPLAAKVALIAGVATIAVGYFVPPFNLIVQSMNDYYFLGTVFGWLVVVMLIIGEMRPRETDWIQEDVGAVDMTPWRLSGVVGGVLIVIVISIYITFADFSVLAPDDKATEAAVSTDVVPDPQPDSVED
jgi:SSS family solute:Na+ symporter